MIFSGSVFLLNFVHHFVHGCQEWREITDCVFQCLWAFLFFLFLQLLSEMGLISCYPHRSEVEIWLSHLCHKQLYGGHRETLLRFLDEVFTAVAAEPYVYADIIIDMQTEAVAQEASEVQFVMDSSNWNWSSNTRFDFNHLNLCFLDKMGLLLSGLPIQNHDYRYHEN